MMPKSTLSGLFLATAFTFTSVVARAADPPRRENVSSADPRTPEEERRGFHLPDGFTIELVASEPEIHKPMNLAFDDRGRLWVTETVEYPYPAAEGTTPRDSVKILTDFGPDGRAATIRTFAEGLNIPIGLLPKAGGRSAIVYSIPNISLLSDLDGDGRSDRREVLYATFGSRDTHGMTNAFTWGFDGWVYACHGFSNTSTVAGADQSAITMQSGNVYRMRPDGTHLEWFTHGQVNPFGLAFDPVGNLYSCDCHSRPVYQLLRGGWYPSFGKPHDGLGFAPEMVTHDHGSTGISGISVYAADAFPEPYRGTVFIGNVVTNRINHDRVEWHGSTPRGIAQPDFLQSDDPWFRPVDIELGPDGALYVADFYNRIIGHYEVPLTHPGRDRERGRIWRIVYRGSERSPRPLSSRDQEPAARRSALIADLGHPNLTVRIMAANQLAELPPDLSMAAIATGDENPSRRVHASWVLQRHGILDEATLQAIAADPAAEVRVHAMRVLGERAALPGELHALALRGLGDADPLVRRSAADALGRHPDPANLRPLLDLLQATSTDDTHLVHTVRMALRDQLGSDLAWARIDGLALGAADLRIVAEVALGVPTAASARFLLDQLGNSDAMAAADLQVRFAHQIARHGGEGTELELIRLIAQRADAGLVQQAALLKACQQGAQERGRSPGAEARNLAMGVSAELLDSPSGKEVLAGIQLAGAYTLKGLQDRLAVLTREARDDEPTRAAALTALAAISPAAAAPVLGQVLGNAADPVPLREQAAGLLGASAGPLPGAEETLVTVLATAPARLQTAIAAALAHRPTGAKALLATVAAGKASPRLLQEPRVLAALNQAGLPDLKDQLDSLLKGVPSVDDRLRALLNRRRQRFEALTRDPAQGALVFEKNCIACHQLQGKGARIGPQLDGIGTRGVDRLLEDLLDPNRNVDQAFRTTQLALTDGRLVAGLLLREEGEVLVLADAQGKEVRVSRAEVEEQSLSPLSPMPANFADQVTEDDLGHLLDYLLKPQPAQVE